MNNEIKKAVEVINKGGIILYPTDTLWGLGCDANNAKAVQRIYSLKGKVKESKFIVLLPSIDDIRTYVKEVPEILFDLLDSIDFPTTVIYPGAQKLAKNVIAKDQSIAIRIIHEGPAHDLLVAYGKPIVSTSANYAGEKPPLLFKDISKSLIKEVDFVFETGRTNVQKMRASTIIKLKTNGEFEIIRD